METVIISPSIHNINFYPETLQNVNKIILQDELSKNKLVGSESLSDQSDQSDLSDQSDQSDSNNLSNSSGDSSNNSPSQSIEPEENLSVKPIDEKKLPPPQKKTVRYRNLRNLKRIIFPLIEEHKLNSLMIDEESISYISFASSAQDITCVIMNNLDDFPIPEGYENFMTGESDPTAHLSFNPQDVVNKWNNLAPIKKMKELVITDMTAGVGGNVLNFANYFKYVNAIEIDSLRCEYLKKNVNTYDHLNVNCYCDDSVKVLIKDDEMVQDIVYIDPPWCLYGFYKLYTNLRLKLGDYSIEVLCKMLFQKKSNKLIALKLPNNYDYEYMRKELADYKFAMFNIERMVVVILKNY